MVDFNYFKNGQKVKSLNFLPIVFKTQFNISNTYKHQCKGFCKIIYCQINFRGFNTFGKTNKTVFYINQTSHYLEIKFN